MVNYGTEQTIPSIIFLVSNMYVYEGRDYSKETSVTDQQAFDNMVAGKVVALSKKLASVYTRASFDGGPRLSQLPTPRKW